MKKYNKKSLAAGALLGAAVVMSGVAFAANDTSSDLQNEIRFHNSEHKVQNTEAKAAMDAGDYDAFIAATSDKKGLEMTEEKFALIQKMHTARESRDKDQIKALRSEMKAAGFGKRGHEGDPEGHGSHKDHKGHKNYKEHKGRVTEKE